MPLPLPLPLKFKFFDRNGLSPQELFFGELNEVNYKEVIELLGNPEVDFNMVIPRKGIKPIIFCLDDSNIYADGRLIIAKAILEHMQSIEDANNLFKLTVDKMGQESCNNNDEPNNDRTNRYSSKKTYITPITLEILILILDKNSKKPVLDYSKIEDRDIIKDLLGDSQDFDNYKFYDDTKKDEDFKRDIKAKLFNLLADDYLSYTREHKGQSFNILDIAAAARFKNVFAARIFIKKGILSLDPNVNDWIEEIKPMISSEPIKPAQIEISGEKRRLLPEGFLKERIFAAQRLQLENLRPRPPIAILAGK